MTPESQITALDTLVDDLLSKLIEIENAANVDFAVSEKWEHDLSKFISDKNNVWHGIKPFPPHLGNQP